MSSSPSIIPFRDESSQRAGLWYKLVDDQQAVSAQLDHPATALQLLGWDHLTALTEDGLPWWTGEHRDTETSQQVRYIQNIRMCTYVYIYISFLNYYHHLTGHMQTHPCTDEDRRVHSEDKTKPTLYNRGHTTDCERHATPGGAFDVYPLSFLGKRVALWLKGFKTVYFHSLPLSHFQSLLNWSATIAARLFGCTVPQIKYQMGDRNEQTGQSREEMVVLCLECSFWAAQCRCSDVTSSAPRWAWPWFCRVLLTAGGLDDIWQAGWLILTGL